MVGAIADNGKNTRRGCASEKRSMVFVISPPISHSRVGDGWQGGARVFGVARCSGEASPLSVFQSGRPKGTRHNFI